MKKILSVFLSILFVVNIVPLFTAFAANDFVVDDGVLVKYNGSATAVTIPKEVTSIADEAFAGNTKIASVAMHNGVLSIGNKAFYGCTALKTVSFADNVTYVGALAFVNKKYLEDSTAQYLTIGKVLVDYNGTSKTPVIPDSVISIAPYAFLRNKTITSVTIPDNVTTISEGAFYECTALATVNGAQNVTYVGADSFTSTK